MNKYHAVFKRISFLKIPKREQFQPFPNRTDCHTEQIAMPYGLWPSSHKLKKYRLKFIFILKYMFLHMKQID